MKQQRDISDLSRRLWERRKACGLTLQAVAKELGVRGHAQISANEGGLAVPSLVRLGELADVYGCSVHDLIPEDW